MNYIELMGTWINLDQTKAVFTRQPGDTIFVDFRLIPVEDFQIVFDHAGDDERCIIYGKNKSGWRRDWDRILGRVSIAQEVPNDG